MKRIWVDKVLDHIRIAADRTYLRTSIYRSHIGSRFDCTTKGHGWVIESKPSAIGIEDGRTKSNKM